MRLIDADELLRKLEEYFNKKEQDAKFTGNRGSEVSWNDAIYYIRTAPSAQPEQRWISCSERLPERREMVLICKQKRNHPFTWTRETEQIDVAWRDIEGRSGDMMWLTRYFEWIHDDKVIAWMPLPEPYREEGEK